MRAADIVRAAIPDADDDLVDHIVFGRTPYPFLPMTARMLFKAAHGFHRACANKRQLCDFCRNQVTTHRWTCDACQAALDTARAARGVDSSTFVHSEP